MAKVAWTALAYPAAGAAAGAVVGFVVGSPGRALATVGPWVLGLAVVAAAGAGAWAGGRGLLARRRLAVEAPPPRPDAVPVAVDLPQVEAGFPDVWGAGDALEVVVRAAPGAEVTLATSPPLALEPVSPGRFRLRAPEGEVVLHAVATVRDARGEAVRAVTFARYGQEIRRMVDDFRAWAETNVPEAKAALTARELMEKVAARTRPEGHRALLALARAYEVVTYGERPADRALYAEVVRAFAALERAGLFEAPAAAEATAQ